MADGQNTMWMVYQITIDETVLQQKQLLMLPSPAENIFFLLETKFER